MFCVNANEGFAEVIGIYDPPRVPRRERTACPVVSCTTAVCRHEEVLWIEQVSKNAALNAVQHLMRSNPWRVLSRFSHGLRSFGFTSTYTTLHQKKAIGMRASIGFGRGRRQLKKKVACIRSRQLHTNYTLCVYTVGPRLPARARPHRPANPPSPPAHPGPDPAPNGPHLTRGSRSNSSARGM